jgi:hypothetical protein
VLLLLLVYPHRKDDVVRSRLWLLPALVAAALAAALVGTGSARSAARACGPAGYGYAGLQAPDGAAGVSASVTSLITPVVQAGHVAAWIGIGAPHEGPRGTDEWLQIGLNAISGNTPTLYYEVAQPWGKHYVDLKRQVVPGRPVRISVLEMAGRPSVWRVWLDGRPASKPIWLPESHRRLTPMALAENWNAGAPACNRYVYRFGSVQLAASPGGGWKPFRMRNSAVLADPGLRVVPAATGGFVAVATGAGATRSRTLTGVSGHPRRPR